MYREKVKKCKVLLTSRLGQIGEKDLTHLNNVAGYKFYSNILSNLNNIQQDITKSLFI